MPLSQAKPMHLLCGATFIGLATNCKQKKCALKRVSTKNSGRKILRDH